LKDNVKQLAAVYLGGIYLYPLTLGSSARGI
jgi:hypothetical protein